MGRVEGIGIFVGSGEGRRKWNWNIGVRNGMVEVEWEKGEGAKICKGGEWEKG